MKILLYTYDLIKIGGIETSFYNLAQYLKQQGYEVGVRYSIAADMQRKRYIDAGIDIQQAKREYCDVLLIGSMYKRPNKIIAKVTIQQCHADWSDEFWRGAHTANAVSTIKRASGEVDMFTAVSESAASFVSKYTDKPVIIMNNLAPKTKKVEKKKHSDTVFAAFTRMTLEKGLKNYQAFRERVIELGINAEFRVYTNGEAPEGWTLYEPVPDITKEFSEVDVVCSLADTESFGYTIAEANSSGIPCVIKKTNSTPEFFSGAGNLILDDPSDFDKNDIPKKVTKYDLRESSEQSITDAIDQFKQLQKGRCIIRSRRAFNDLVAKKQRVTGEEFSVTTQRAKELLNHELKLVERV